MLLSNYQITEIIFSAVFFIVLYGAYLALAEPEFRVYNLIWCTITLFLILLFKNFYMNFNILQSQNLSYNNINAVY
jgi:hypothetical protein